MRAQLAAAAQLLASPPLLAAAFDEGCAASDAGAKCENALLQVGPFCKQRLSAFRLAVAGVTEPPVQPLCRVQAMSACSWSGACCQLVHHHSSQHITEPVAWQHRQHATETLAGSSVTSANASQTLCFTGRSMQTWASRD